MSVAVAVASIGVGAAIVLLCWVVVIRVATPGWRRSIAVLFLGITSLEVVVHLGLVLSGENVWRRTTSVSSTIAVVLAAAVNPTLMSLGGHRASRR